MIRLAFGFVFAVALVALVANPQNASAQKGGNNGTLSKVDPKTGSITINMLVVAKKKKELTDKEYFLNDDARVTIVEGGSKKTLTGKEAIASGALKPGVTVTFVPENNLKIKELMVGAGGKAK